MRQHHRLLRLIADGQFHSGEDLGAALGIGRSAVWKLVRSLSAYGLDVFAVRGRGYRLAHRVELLDAERIRAALPRECTNLLGGLDILTEISSTNGYLMERVPQLANGHACFAEYQSAGRGRHGRSWVSPLGASIYLSVFHRFDSAPDALQGLSLAIGVAAAEALSSVGVRNVGLKWPNDLVLERRKLGGILLEMAGEASGPWNVVCGIGVNVRIPSSSGRLIDQPWTDVHAAGGTPDRNLLAGRLLRSILSALERFARDGFAAFREAWASRDSVRDLSVVVSDGGRERRGIARGVDETGALLLAVEGSLKRCIAGDVSLRLSDSCYS